MTPRATYRLQLNPAFGFADAAALAPYLAGLGISHVYLSPVFAARPGSTHGYDVTDPTRLNPELGSAEDFHAMAAAFRAEGLGLVLDVVPNHMGIGGEANAFWLDVLEWGRRSRFASWFDIDWESAAPGLAGKVLVPVLGEPYGVALAEGALELRFDAEAGSFAVWAHGAHKLPLSPATYPAVLRAAGLDALAAEASALAANPDDRTWRELRARIAHAEAAAAAVERFRGVPRNRASWEALDALIAGQHWRPARFSLAAEALNYRRFFTISDLAGLRVEDETVFEATHKLVLSLVADGTVDGLRIDHIDGLRDPGAYLDRLRGRIGGSAYLLVEKILGPDEPLPDWPVDGTTGYEVTNLLVGLLVDPAGSESLTATYEAFVGKPEPPEEIVRAAKREIMTGDMAAELGPLVHRLAELACGHPRFGDLGPATLREALVATVAALDVYRTYADEGGISEADRARVAAAVRRARAGARGLDPLAFDLVEAATTLDPGLGGDVGEFTVRLQQFTGPVTAKGLEDRALYRYNRLIALNEVGSEPGRFATSVGEFHAANAERLRTAPRSMLTTSTHDTKRGEDARARIAAIGRHAAAWRDAVFEWQRLLARPEAPVDPNEAYFFYQLLLGAWPAEWRPDVEPEALDELRGRVSAAMLKSVREAAVNTGWTFGDPAYEAAVERFVARALKPGSAFLRAFRSFEAALAPDGAANALIQTALKLTIPGVPDTYQGAELWDQSLVDPDNRRPVDFALRARLLAEDAPSEGGGAKLALTRGLLQLRRERPDLFLEGSYEPLQARGAGAASVCAFARRWQDQALVVAVALRHGDERPDGSTRLDLPAPLRGAFHDVPTGGLITELADAAVLDGSPVAVLVR
jgi:(1->4)-alpha-D-glucan 1-alpha-D-glucosylmutase